MRTGRTRARDRTGDPQVVLGLSAGFHDSSACVLVGGQVMAAVAEERLTRKKHDAAFPERAADTCLAIAGLRPADIDVVAFHEKPLGVVSRHVASRLRNGPFSAGHLVTSTPRLLSKELSVGRVIERWFRHRDAPVPAVLLAEHHTSHAAAAFYPSPFRSAAIMTVDGAGEWATGTIGAGHEGRITTDLEMRFPDSVGLLYSAFTAYCGFRVNSGEGELMGLAPFGDPCHVDAILEHLVHLRDDGSFSLDPRYFTYTRGRRTTGRRFHRLFGGPPRAQGHPPGRREADLAASIQVVVEMMVLRMAAEAHRVTGLDALCLGGGVALNCVANGRLLREGPFKEVWIQPAAGDDGNSVGAALWAWHQILERPRVVAPTDGMNGAFLGPHFETQEIQTWAEEEGIAHTVLAEHAEVCEIVARRLAAGEVVGWFQGRMEFGPRALGHRSILADPRRADAQAQINHLVKERAGFRPFAPAVLVEHADRWFEHSDDAPYMNIAAPVRAEHRTAPPATRLDLEPEAAVKQVRSTIPAVTHVDYSARIQTVDDARNPEFSGLLRAFERLTGCPILLNTSFNGHDEPVVCTPADALRTFRATGLDLLVMERVLVERP